MSESNLFGERDLGEAVIKIVNELVARIESHPVNERRKLLLAPALLGKTIATESLNLIVKDVTFEEFSSNSFRLDMYSIISDGIMHLLRIALLTLPNSDATWECVVDESTRTLKLGRSMLRANAVGDLGADDSYYISNLLEQRILELEKIIPAICHKFAKSNGRLKPNNSSEAAWRASFQGSHTSGLRRAERREQSEDGEYETGIPWAKNDPYSPE